MGLDRPRSWNSFDNSSDYYFNQFDKTGSCTETSTSKARSYQTSTSTVELSTTSPSEIETVYRKNCHIYLDLFTIFVFSLFFRFLVGGSQKIIFLSVYMVYSDFIRLMYAEDDIDIPDNSDSIILLEMSSTFWIFHQGYDRQEVV
jgi:hypothetical protein